MVRLLQGQEFRLGIVESRAIVEANEVFAPFICAYGDALLWETSILLDVPDLEDPVRVQRIDTATTLVTNHIDDIVMLERGPGPKVHRLEGTSG